MSQENSFHKQPLIRFVNRREISWRAVDVERLIREDHPARTIWDLVGRLDLSRFNENIESHVEEGERAAIDPQLRISLWVYTYSEGIGSAREVARRCEFDPAFQWLTGLDEGNYHTRADFRVDKQQELDELFTQVLAALSKQGLMVGLAVTQAAKDSAQLLPAVERIKERLKKTPQQVVAGGVYTTRDNIEKMAKREIDFLGAWGENRCPAE
jgi:transposase